MYVCMYVCMYICMYLYIYAIICVYYCNYVHWHVLVTYNANLKKEQQTNRTGAPGFLLLLHPGPAAESSWWGYKEFLRQTLRRPSLKYRNISCSHLNIYIFDITKQNHWGSAVLRLAKGNLKVWANLSASSNPGACTESGNWGTASFCELSPSGGLDLGRCFGGCFRGQLDSKKVSCAMGQVLIRGPWRLPLRIPENNVSMCTCVHM